MKNTKLSNNLNLNKKTISNLHSEHILGAGQPSGLPQCNSFETCVVCGPPPSQDCQTGGSLVLPGDPND